MRVCVCGALVVAGLCGVAGADVIAFDDAYAVLGEEGDPNGFYAGVTFLSGYVGLQGGLGNGDDGNWLIEGTNGSVFLGWNGPYDGGLQFAGDIVSISFDVSRSNGSSAGQTLSVEYYDDGGLVGSELVALGGLNEWSTVSFGAAVFDEVRWAGSDVGFSPYGIDNIVYNIPSPMGGAVFAGALLAHRRRRR